MTPVGTPESTGDPDYKITHALQNSIGTQVDEQHADIGTNKYYGPFVHQGTYDWAHGYGGWTEAEAREFDSLTDTGRGDGIKGMKPRPFLVNGLLNARPAIAAIWSTPIKVGISGSKIPKRIRR